MAAILSQCIFAKLSVFGIIQFYFFLIFKTF